MGSAIAEWMLRQKRCQPEEFQVLCQLAEQSIAMGIDYRPIGGKSAVMPVGCSHCMVVLLGFFWKGMLLGGWLGSSRHLPVLSVMLVLDWKR